MSADLDNLIKDMLSPIADIRKAAETKLNYFMENMKIEDLDTLLNHLMNSKNEDIKIFICVIIRKFISSKITQENTELFIRYFSQIKIKFIEILLHKGTTIRLIKNLLVCFLDGLTLLKTNESFCIDNILDIFSYFSQYYLSKKNSNEIKDINRCLFIFEKFIKFIARIPVNQKLENAIKNFYSNIINDYKINIGNIINGNLNTDIFSLVLETAIYYLKLFKHSSKLVDDSFSDVILNNTYELDVYILNNLISNNTFNNNEEISKFIFDIIFLSNKIIIIYISQVSTLSIQTLQKYADIFYIYVKEENIFNYINNLLQKSKNIPENMRTKFLFDIINFFYELLQLCSIQEFTELQIFGKGFTENAIEISDFFRNKYWDKEKIKNLLLFILKNYFALKPNEIMMGQNEPEDFYLLFYNSDSNHYDLRGNAGKVCRIIYDIFSKEIIDIYLSFENELFSLTKLEYDLINKNQHLTDNQINIKLSLLSYYYHVDMHFSSKKLDNQKWLDQILLSQIDPNIIIKKNEIFSTFYIMYILTKVNSYISDSKTKYMIFLKILDLFIYKNINNLLLNLSCIDYIYDYVDEEVNNIQLPKNIINNYIIKICQILDEVSSPDIHNKILETTNNLLKKTVEDELSLIFPEIFPTLQKIWENNSNSINNNYNNGNKLILIRSNLIKLIELFVKKIGFFISYEDDNTNQNNINNNITNQNFYPNYFNFIYQMLGYSIDVKVPYCDYLCKSAFNLIIYIQDDFFNNSSLSLLSSINELHNPLNSSYFFNYFIKTYQYLDILLSNLSNSNQYFISQFAAIEQFISFSFEKEISIIIDNINFVEKIIYIFDYFIKNYINQYNLYIFNTIEYIFYIIFSHSKINEQNKKKLNDFIYQIIQNIFGDNNFENKINTLIEKYDKNLDDIYFCKDDDIYLINIYIGIIQLTNRYIFTNASYNNYINNDLNIFLAKKIISLTKFLTEKNNVLNIIQKNILRNSVFNLKILLNENIDTNLNQTLNELYKNISKSNYISKSDKILSHWLYFFNKIYNDYYSTKLDNEEEVLKYHWKKNIEKDVQLIDNENKDYKIKYLMVASDPMYDNENK